MNNVFKRCIFVLLMIVACAFVFGCKENGENNISSDETKIELPWENGGKQPSEYTWEEFNDLTGPQQIKFQNSFSSSDEFEQWMFDAQNGHEEIPWENGGKQPVEYTWDEFEALSGDLQIKFQNSFKSDDDFEKWMNEAKGIAK